MLVWQEISKNFDAVNFRFSEICGWFDEKDMKLKKNSGISIILTSQNVLTVGTPFVIIKFIAEVYVVHSLCRCYGKDGAITMSACTLMCSI